ncbi:PAS domain-containing sensor histidine kinase [Antarcticimicrobium sediminis]|uniref:histidine kinase n=1 Tax=Antarcticimicrobium sediminis TaxID=2546227 RepID=A0A4R5EXX0_9RHOB|nr:PAS domain-containing sensor histidine kinase [Antarcticimicrobium sediminis]TDE39851.1 PAS domain S-box protein [Antarcticimicrobium sediminis]
MTERPKNIEDHSTPPYSAIPEISSYRLHPTSEKALGEGFLSYALDQHASVSIADATGRITYVNDKFLGSCGYERHELIGQNHRLLNSGYHSREFYSALWSTIASGKTWSGEMKNRKKSGEPYWIKSTIVPRLNEIGKPAGFLSIRTDITLEKAAEALKVQQETFNFSHSEVYMYWADNLKLFYLNEMAQDRWKLKKRELYGKTPMDFDSKFSNGEVIGIFNRIKTGEKNVVSVITESTRTDGTTYPVEVSAQLVHPEGGRPRFVVLVQDITDRMKAEKAKSEFIATVNHELRTPLTSLKGALDLIKSGVGGKLPDKAGNLIDIADRSSARLGYLINNLLDAEKIEKGNIVSDMERVDMSHVIEAAIREVSSHSIVRKNRICSFGTASPVCVMGDRDRLFQVIENLLSNALKFSNADDIVEVTLVREKTMVRVSVKDIGIGMPEDITARIFDRFTQADSTDHRKVGGVGLGLSLVKAIIDDHGGTINCVSEVGKGTTFSFCLKRRLDWGDE